MAEFDLFIQAVSRYGAVFNNDEKKHYESVFQEYVKKAESALRILEFLLVNREAPYNQLVLIMLRKAIKHSVNDYSAIQVMSLRQQTMNLILTETKTRNINLVADVIIDLLNSKPISDWPELSSYLFNFDTSPSPEGFLIKLTLIDCLIDEGKYALNSAEKSFLWSASFELIQRNNVQVSGVLVRVVANIFGQYFDDESSETATLNKCLLDVMRVLQVCLSSGCVQALETDISKLLAVVAEQMSSNAFQFQKIEATQLIFEFILSNRLFYGTFPLTLAEHIFEILHLLIDVNPRLYFKSNDPGVLLTLFAILAQILIAEETKINQNSKRDDFEFDEEENMTMIPTVMVLIHALSSTFSKEKQIFHLLKQLRENELEVKGFMRLSLLVLSSTGECFKKFYSKEIKTLSRKLIDCLSVADRHLVHTTLRTVAGLCNDIGDKLISQHATFVPKILELLEMGIRSLESSNKADIPGSILLIIEQSFLAIEIIIENIEVEEQKPYSTKIFTLVLHCLEIKSESLKFLEKPAVACLGAIFASSDSGLLVDNMQGLVNVLKLSSLSLSAEGQSLISIGKLLYYALKDDERRNELFNQYFVDLVKNCVSTLELQVVADDLEKYDGALTVVYYFCKVFKRDSKELITQKLFKQLIEIFEDRVIDVDELEEEEERVKSKTMTDKQKIPVSLQVEYMVTSALHLFGECLRYFPDILITSNEVMTKVDEIIELKLYSVEEEIRFQTFLTVIKLATGLVEYKGLFRSEMITNAIEYVITEEENEMERLRNLEALEDFLVDLQSISTFDKKANFVFFEKIVTALRDVFQQHKEQVCGDDIYIASMRCLSEILKILDSNESSMVWLNISALVVNPLNNDGDVNEDIIAELIGCLAEVIEVHPSFAATLFKNPAEISTITKYILNAQSLENEDALRNSVFFVGVLSLGSENSLMVDSMGGVLRLIQWINEIYCSADVEAIKDNCVAACLKLYYNPVFTASLSGIMTNDQISAFILQRIPLKGDEGETPIYLQAILELVKISDFRNSFYQNTKFIIFAISCLIKQKEWKIAGRPALLAGLVSVIKEMQTTELFAQVVMSLDARTRNQLQSISLTH